jgi:hypothetical protein
MEKNKSLPFPVDGMLNAKAILLSLAMYVIEFAARAVEVRKPIYN